MKNRLSKFEPYVEQVRQFRIPIREHVVDSTAAMVLGDLVAAGRLVEIDGNFADDFDAFESVNAVGPLTMVERMIEAEVKKQAKGNERKK